MKKTLLSLALVASFAFADEARDLVKRVLDRDDGQTLSQDMTMVLIDKNQNQRVRSLKTFSKDFSDSDRKIMFFLSPSDVKNTAFLNYDYTDPSRDDDQWLYLPALKKVKRIPSSDKSSAFMGSDFSYYDMTKRNLDDYSYTIKKKTKLNGHDVVMIESIPTNQKVIKESGYTKTIGLIRPDIDMVVRSIAFLKNGKKKYFEVKKLHQQDGIWVIDEMTMTTKDGKTMTHKTILNFDNIKVNKPISDNIFTTRRLEKGL